MDTSKDRRAEERGERSEQLLPGLPDEITLDRICTRLRWNASHVLSCVSHKWLDSIQSRRVYDARVRSNTTETLVVLQHCTRPPSPPAPSLLSRCFSMSIYSLRENRCYQIPGMRDDGGFRKCFDFVALDGKIYCFGEEAVDKVLDLGGQKPWEPFGRMEEPGSNFRSVVLDRKIYVCGGVLAELQDPTPLRKYPPTSRCEVYDPETNAWSSIAAMKSKRYYHCMTTLRGELFAYGGFCVREKDGVASEDHFDPALFLEVYDADKDKWRVVSPFGPLWWEFGRKFGRVRLFVAQGKLHAMSKRGIYVLDGSVEENEWTKLHSLSFEGAKDFPEIPVLDMNGELLVACLLPISSSNTGRKVGLAISKGFGFKTEELVWENVNCPVDLDHEWTNPFMCVIEL